jgi:hypothetical protein
VLPKVLLFWLILTLAFGWFLTCLVWPSVGPAKDGDWAAFAAGLASTSASMLSLTVAMVGLLYALLGTPLVGFLHKKKALNPLLFNLMAASGIWLLSLGLGLAASLPDAALAVPTALHIASALAVAGLLYFIPIGMTFWDVMKHSGDQPGAAVQHDFDKPTDLQ